MIQFRVDGLPQTKGSTKGFAIPNKARPGKHRVVITNDNTKNKGWAALVSAEAQKHRPKALITGPVDLTLIFYLPIPKSLPKSKRTWHIKKPDLSKLTRSVEDALTGIVWRDDSQIMDSCQRKVYSDTPGVNIIVQAIIP
jgi:Holliday junction resolvase RusA-like endonuclease